MQVYLPLESPGHFIIEDDPRDPQKIFVLARIWECLPTESKPLRCPTLTDSPVSLMGRLVVTSVFVV